MARFAAHVLGVGMRAQATLHFPNATWDTVKSSRYSMKGRRKVCGRGKAGGKAKSKRGHRCLKCSHSFSTVYIFHKIVEDSSELSNANIRPRRLSPVGTLPETTAASEPHLGLLRTIQMQAREDFPEAGTGLPLQSRSPHCPGHTCVFLPPFLCQASKVVNTPCSFAARKTKWGEAAGLPLWAGSLSVLTRTCVHVTVIMYVHLIVAKFQQTALRHLEAGWWWWGE